MSSEAPNRPLLSAAIIVRDEAEYLAGCLASIRDVCDEIVVVDTGSVDDSVDVARSFGAVLGRWEWNGDFAAARNEALRLASGEWILYIDADEQLEAVDAAAVSAELEANADAVALTVWFRSKPEFSPYREFRMWRHRPDIRFSGRIHETMVPDIRRVAADESMAIRDSALMRLTHYGYVGDQTAKHHRNLPMLEARVAEYSDRCYLWNHLAEVRMALGDTEGALEAWGQGVALVRTRGLRDRPDVLCYAGLGMYLVNTRIDITDLIDELRGVAPWFRTIDWMAACNHRAHERFAESVPHLDRLIETGPDPVDAALAYHNGMFTEWAWEALADSYIELGDMPNAAEVYRIASAARPGRLDYRAKAVALSAR